MSAETIGRIVLIVFMAYGAAIVGGFIVHWGVGVFLLAIGLVVAWWL